MGGIKREVPIKVKFQCKTKTHLQIQFGKETLVLAYI